MRLIRFLPAALFAASLPVHALPFMQPSWLPQTPGFKDDVYLTFVYPHAPCSDLKLPQPFNLSANAAGQVVVDVKFSGACAQPVVAFEPYAIAIPESLQGLPVLYRETNVDSGTVEEVVLLPPKRKEIPPSVAGTWFSTEHANQGLNLALGSKSELIMSWFTYDASGAPAWLYGVGDDDPNIVSRRDVPLNEAGRGAFAAASTIGTAPKTWGSARFEYVACGEAILSWSPTGDPATAGTTHLRQLTPAFGTMCDPAAWAAEYGHAVKILRPTAQ